MAVEVFGSKNNYFNSLIENAFADIGYKNIKVNFIKGVDEGANFMGVLHRLSMEGELRGKSKKIHLIAKTISDDESSREKMPIETFFAVETLMYNVVFPKLERLQNEEEIKIKFTVPKCILASNEKFKEIVVMEDLNEQGYEMSKIGITLDYEHSVLMLHKVAKYHALSMVYKARYPESFREITKSACFTQTISSQLNFLTGSIKYAVDNIHTQAFKEVIAKYQSFDYIKTFCYQDNGENFYDRAIIVHGDLWGSNFLFRYKDGKPEDIMILDWQCSKLRSPAFDVLFALFIAVSEDIRKKKFQELLNIYYTALCQQIEEFGESPLKLYPENIFKEDLKTFSYAAISFAIFLLPIFTSKYEEVKNNMDSTLIPGEAFSFGSVIPSDLYIRRMEQMAEDIKSHNLDELW